jgi:hypothetical protein
VSTVDVRNAEAPPENIEYPIGTRLSAEIRYSIPLTYIITGTRSETKKKILFVSI